MNASTRLRASPAFALAHTMDGRPYLAEEAEPYRQFWLSARERGVWSAFAGRGAALAAGLASAGRLLGEADGRRLQRTVDRMREAGVLIDGAADTSRYDRRIVEAYVKHRPFPQPIADAIVEAGGIGPESRVLDLAGGPGSLALALARVSRHVTLMDLSRGFVQAARARAKAAGLPLRALHESANRLMFHDEAQDVITVSQALHWLDDVAVCRGVGRVLNTGGHCFVVHAAIEVADRHPLAHLFGWDSVLGKKRRQPFADEVAPMAQRLAGLFDALHEPGTVPVVPAGTRVFTQRRPIDEAYARAFLTDRHLEVTGQPPAVFWAELGARCAGLPAQRFEGRMHFALLHFRRGPAGATQRRRPSAIAFP